MKLHRTKKIHKYKNNQKKLTPSEFNYVPNTFKTKQNMKKKKILPNIANLPPI